MGPVKHFLVFPVGPGAKPQPGSNLVHFALKPDIWWQQLGLTITEIQLTKFRLA